MSIALDRALVFSTRLEPLPEDLSSLLACHDMDLVRIPMLEDISLRERRLESIHDIRALFATDVASANLWLVFSSMYAIDLLLEDAELVSRLAEANIAVLSSAAATRFEMHGIRVSFIASRANGETLASELLAKLNKASGVQLHFICGQDVASAIPDYFGASKHQFSEHVLYEFAQRSFNSVELKHLHATLSRLQQLDALDKAFILASDVRSLRVLLQLTPKRLVRQLKEVPVVCIGESTKEGIHKLGFVSTQLAVERSMKGLIMSVVEQYTS